MLSFFAMNRLVESESRLCINAANYMFENISMNLHID